MSNCLSAAARGLLGSLLLLGVSDWAAADGDDAQALGRTERRLLAAAALDLGEFERVAASCPVGVLASCIRSPARSVALACLEAARFVPPASELASAAAERSATTDRALALAAVALLESTLAGLADSERVEDLRSHELASVFLKTLSGSRLGPDLRASLVRSLGPGRIPKEELLALLADGDPRIRREAVRAARGQRAARARLRELAASSRDPLTAVLAALELGELGSLPGEVDRRMREMLGSGKFGPGTLAPLIGQARGRADSPYGEWLAAARANPRPDVRALASLEPMEREPGGRR